MGFLEGLFGRNGRERADGKTASLEGDGFDYATLKQSTDKSAPMEVFKPMSFNDVEKIIDTLRMGKNAIVHLEYLKPATALRVLDMLSGAVYALKGGLYEIQKNTYMFSPAGLTVR